jgi:betaine-aldehyde dehydrogenase
MNTVSEQIKKLSGHHYINNEFVKGSGVWQKVINPATEEEIGFIADATPDQIEKAIVLANEAQKSWWQQNAAERADALHEVGIKLRECQADVGEALTREIGKPYAEAAWEAGAGYSAFNYYAQLARQENGRVAAPLAPGHLHVTLKEPLGVVVSILPFNFPLLLLSWQVAAALAAGNAVIIKPSDLTSLCTLLVMKAFDHLPKGLVQVLTGGVQTGKTLVEHKHTHAIAFTGSVGAGIAIAQGAAKRFKPALIEASGNDPFIIMPSAPIDIVAKAATSAAFLNCGQVCTSAERFYVHEAIYDQFLKAFAEHVKKLRIGNGLDKVDIGPMAAERERTRFEKILARAVEQGAKVVTGGKRPAHLTKGWFFEPTILETTKDMEIMHTEPFGPVAPICKVSSFEEAIALANDSEFGLGANIFTRDLNEAMRAVNEIESGIVWVNNGSLSDNDGVPFGGCKMTGMGRELGIEGLEQFRRSKMVMIQPEAKVSPEWFPYPDEYAYQK